MAGKIKIIVLHVVENAGQPFTHKAFTLLFQFFRTGIRGVNIGRPRSVAHHIRKYRIPYIAGDIAVFTVGLGDKGAYGAAIGIAQYSDPASFAATGEITRPGPAHG